MMTADSMERDDDVERLFSWLQTPEIRYREFAGEREVTNVAVTRAAPRTVIEEGPPVDSGAARQPGITASEYEIAAGEPVASGEAVLSEPPMIAPIMARSVPEPRVPSPPAMKRQMFTLGAERRGGVLRPLGTPTTASPSPPMPRAHAPLESQPAVPEAHEIPAERPAPASGSGLLGGTHREEGPNGGAGPLPPPGNQERSGRSLDAVFNRLAGGRASDPSERLRHIPGLGPITGRPR